MGYTAYQVFIIKTIELLALDEIHKKARHFKKLEESGTKTDYKLINLDFSLNETKRLMKVCWQLLKETNLDIEETTMSSYLKTHRQDFLDNERFTKFYSACYTAYFSAYMLSDDHKINEELAAVARSEVSIIFNK